MVICTKFISETNKNDPEDFKFNYYCVETNDQCDLRATSSLFSISEPDFSIQPKEKYVKKKSEIKDEELNPHEERKLGIE